MSIEHPHNKQFKTVEESLNSLAQPDPDKLVLESQIEQHKIEELLKKINADNNDVPEKKKLLERIGKKTIIAAVMGLFAVGYTADFFVQKIEGKHALRNQYDAERKIYDTTYVNYAKGDSMAYYGLKGNLKKLQKKEDELGMDEKEREHDSVTVAPKIKTSIKKQ